MTGNGSQAQSDNRDDDRLELVLDQLEDLSQEVDALRSDVRYMILSGIEELEEQVRRRRMTLRARAHFEHRPDLSLEDPDRRKHEGAVEEMVRDSEHEAKG